MWKTKQRIVNFQTWDVSLLPTKRNCIGCYWHQYITIEVRQQLVLKSRCMPPDNLLNIWSLWQWVGTHTWDQLTTIGTLQQFLNIFLRLKTAILKLVTNNLLFLSIYKENENHFVVVEWESRYFGRTVAKGQINITIIDRR